MLTWKTRNIRNACYKIGNKSHQTSDLFFFEKEWKQKKCFKGTDCVYDVIQARGEICSV